ncbi:MAG: hypothetical protein HOV81_43520 [Kofleriaceae bacterium]|nr:hypothetical protein [Kofleriaceae bacterium]
MRPVASALVVGLAACGSDEPECGTNIAEDIFVVAAIDAYGATLGASGAGSVWSCPGGGTATVTGTTTPLGNGTLRDFTVTFADCFDSTASTELTLTGSVHHRGTWIDEMAAAYCESCKVTGSLRVVGTEAACETPHLARDCAIDFTVTGTSSQVVASYEGSVCGFTFP